MRIVIAGGGTGGHLFPGIAIAEEFIRRDGQTKILFIGTQRGLENKMLRPLGYDLQTIDIEGVKGRGLMALARGFYRIPQSMWQSRRIYKKFCPQIVIGVGGYASGPAVLMASFMKIPTVIAEQNVVPGITNRILGKFADRVCVTYAESEKWFSASKVLLSGNPVRAAFADVRTSTRQKKNFREILVFGGSQGASAINRNVVAMLPYLKEMKIDIRVAHQTGAAELEEIREAYRRHKINAEVHPFIADMAAYYRRADLIICRAGATSLAEITAAGKAPILIPYPYAAGDHQAKNAQAMSDACAAVTISEKELSGEKLFTVAASLLGDEKRLRKMEEESAKLGKVNAAAVIVDECLKLAAEN